MFRFGFLSFVLFIGWQYATGSAITATKSVRKADSGLRLIIGPATWSDAAARCQLEGGVLASPTNGALAQSMLNAMNKSGLGSKNVFIGATKLYSGEDFKLLDGGNLAENLTWVKGAPNNAHGTERCLALTGAGKLDDVSCSIPLPYFCRNVTNNYLSNIIPEIPSCVKGYGWEPRTGSCYKIHTKPQAFDKAQITCQVEGGHLAIINSELESTVLKELFNKNPSSCTYAQRCNPKFATIGIKKSPYDGWMTVNGDLVRETGFEKWSPGEPNNGNLPGYENVGTEECGSISRDGLLNDSPCTYNYAFICEINYP